VVNVRGSLIIERCERCLGIFFDPGELEFLFETAVSNVHEIDFGRLNTLLEEQQKNDFPVGYVKCPVCLRFMNRKNYGSRSGVIVDWCKEHGVWLDGGELGVLLRWTKAGGREHQAGREAERERFARQEKAAREYEEHLKTQIDAGEEQEVFFSLLRSIVRGN
jgi:Zn-finger nucleic acid-binding protein